MFNLEKIKDLIIENLEIVILLIIIFMIMYQYFQVNILLIIIILLLVIFNTDIISMFEDLKTNKTSCIIGLIADPERLSDIRRNRVAIMKDQNLKEYTDLSSIKREIEDSKKLFKKYKWPTIDVTRKSVEETAASVIKIFDILNSK